MSENIFNLLPRNTPTPPKPPMYRSKHDPIATLIGSTICELISQIYSIMLDILGTHGTTQLPGASKIKKVKVKHIYLNLRSVLAILSIIWS